ncbi:MAG: hypothetical protein J6J23_03770 [Clostridia bacterium]|nr:hypothetical protein [Clostridia bacterium]
MAIYTILKCTHCDYEHNYDQHTSSIYKYKDVPQIAEYPQTYTGWCYNCKDFTVIAKGINLKNIKIQKQTIIESIIKKCNSFINFSSGTEEPKALLKKIEAYSKIEFAIRGRNTFDYCTKCGKTSIVKKDVTKQLWSCPKCRMGVLSLEKIQDNILFRRGEVEIPISNNNIDIVSDIINCGYEVIFNEGIYLLNTNNRDVMSVLSKNFDAQLLDRLSLICSYIEIFHKIKIHNSILHLIEKRLPSSVMSDSINIKQRLEERTKYFKTEIEIEIGCSHFMPMAIIKTLRTPDGPPARNITGLNPLDAIKHWKIIADTINACFINLRNI